MHGRRMWEAKSQVFERRARLFAKYKVGQTAKQRTGPSIEKLSMPIRRAKGQKTPCSK
jgi:hypothetical protein